jgi:hypothetical protein
MTKNLVDDGMVTLPNGLLVVTKARRKELDFTIAVKPILYFQTTNVLDVLDSQCLTLIQDVEHKFIVLKFESDR